MMFAVPTVDASPVVSAPNCDTSPGASGSFFTESLIALKISLYLCLILRDLACQKSRGFLTSNNKQPEEMCNTIIKERCFGNDQEVNGICRR